MLYSPHQALIYPAGSDSSSGSIRGQLVIGKPVAFDDTVGITYTQEAEFLYDFDSRSSLYLGDKLLVNGQKWIVKGFQHTDGLFFLRIARASLELATPLTPRS